MVSSFLALLLKYTVNLACKFSWTFLISLNFLKLELAKYITSYIFIFLRFLYSLREYPQIMCHNSHFRKYSFCVCVSDQIRSDQSLSRVRLFATSWITAHQASLSITNFRSTYISIHCKIKYHLFYSSYQSLSVLLNLNFQMVELYSLTCQFCNGEVYGWIIHFSVRIFCLLNKCKYYGFIHVLQRISSFSFF